ncbi:MAG: hypothetical protein HY681_11765 [Chloroflexi bacterium]|nr:hypothetical protein [Chloroflexota bacterium]
MKKRNTILRWVVSGAFVSAATLAIAAVSAQGALDGMVVGEAKAQVEQALTVAKVEVQGGMESQVHINAEGTHFSTDSKVVAGNRLAIHLDLNNKSEQPAKARLDISHPVEYKVTAALFPRTADITDIDQIDEDTWELTFRPAAADEEGHDLTIAVVAPITLGNGSTAELSVTISPMASIVAS